MIFLISKEDIDNHMQSIMAVGDPMLGWMWDVETFQRVYFVDSNFPPWVNQS